MNVHHHRPAPARPTFQAAATTARTSTCRPSINNQNNQGNPSSPDGPEPGPVAARANPASSVPRPRLDNPLDSSQLPPTNARTGRISHRLPRLSTHERRSLPAMTRFSTFLCRPPRSDHRSNAAAAAARRRRGTRQAGLPQAAHGPAAEPGPDEAHRRHRDDRPDGPVQRARGHPDAQRDDHTERNNLQTVSSGRRTDWQVRPGQSGRRHQLPLAP